MSLQPQGWSDVGTGLSSPVIRKDADGYCTLEWHGPAFTPVAREVLEQMVAEHNELVTLRRAAGLVTGWYWEHGTKNADAATLMSDLWNAAGQP